MVSKEIKLYQTHIEIFPYKPGDNKALESILSSKLYKPSYSNKNRMVYHSFETYPIGYKIMNNTLYIPRGISVTDLEIWFNTKATLITHNGKIDYIKNVKVLWEPNSKLQENAIAFLSGTDDYSYTQNYSQLGLNLDTGVGKTFSTISAIMKLKQKALIIVHRGKLKTQWIETFINATTLTEDRICDIDGPTTIESMISMKEKDLQYDIYITTHTSIASYFNKYGWDKLSTFLNKLHIGIKVFDEAHLFFKDIILIDCFSNIYKTFYLTATYGRADANEIAVYNRAFSSVVRYGEVESKDSSEGNRKHVVSIISYFSSKSLIGYIPRLETMYGLSVFKYIDYELNNSNTLMNSICKIIENTKNLEGRTLITSSKIESSIYIKEYLSDLYDLDISLFNSKITDDEKIEATQHRYISATVNSVQEAIDISGLRIIINTHPIGNIINIKQLIGRLREYSTDKNTYFYHLVDIKIPKCVNYIKRITPAIEEKSVKSYSIHIDQL